MAPAIPIEFVGQKESRKLLSSGMMGKARKYSRGHSSGFVPDYGHAVETMDESEGFGSSGRIDAEMTVSEDSGAPKRKCISLNADGHNSYGIPKEVMPLSKISRSERKDLIFRLKMELERVQDLHKKLASFSSDIVTLSPYSDIHSWSDGHKRPPPERFERSVGSQGKKLAPAHNNTSRTKKGPSGRSVSARLDVPENISVALVMKKCETLLNRLMSHQYGGQFNSPVDPVKFNIPDYFTVIKHPMDLGTIKSRLCKGEYSSPLDFAADVRLTFSNAMTYNPPGNEYNFMAQALSKYFETRWKGIEKKIRVVEPPSVPLTGSAYVESEIPAKILPLKKTTAAVNESKLNPEPAKRVMTDESKKKLRRELEALEEELPENIVDFLRDHSASDGQTGEDEIEIDIDALSDEILFKLRKLLDDYLVEKQKSQEEGEQCEMEIVHDSGFSNSPVQPTKGDGLIDEDVDIVGGNDPPVSSHLPVKIEKDAACRNNNCSSSSGSSSESGSSSSDSDSSSSSGSESDTTKASNPTAAKDKKSGADTDERVDGSKVGEIVNHSLNKTSRVEQDYEDKPTAIDADGLEDEETAPSERQISPEKLYRAALLKNRFADTILKAREKALDKGEKGDPEKLRIKREELERRRSEEKARIQAEAKAAEDARRKAEAEAAEKTRRKREQEREAARQALQQMEKTVDINENGQLMEDLEMLRAAADDDQLPSFIEETSPEYSQNTSGSFKMRGNSSNPLEQLGLYMKMDEYEEEDEEGRKPLGQNKADEQPFDQNGGGDEQPSNRGKGDEQTCNRNEEDEQPESVPEQENDAMDVEEGEID